MNGYERTVKFVRGEPVDRPPFMPLAIEWISREQGIPYPTSPSVITKPPQVPICSEVRGLCVYSVISVTLFSRISPVMASMRYLYR